MPVISIFGSGKFDEEHYYYKIATDFSAKIALLGFDIATGGYYGIMEAALKGAAKYPVRKIGITTEFYKSLEPNTYITHEFKTNNYFERLQKLVEIGNAYICFPGDSGTLLELATVWTLKTKQMDLNKPIILFGEQWKELIKLMDVYSVHNGSFSTYFDFTNDINDAINLLKNYFGK